MSDGGALGMTPIVRVANISKTYPGVRALHDVGLEVLPGEIHAVIGENGAGKSTLMKIIFGVTQPDAGTIEVQGRVVTIGSPVEAQRLGLSMVHQELTLVPALDVGAQYLCRTGAWTGAGRHRLAPPLRRRRGASPPPAPSRRSASRWFVG